METTAAQAVEQLIQEYGKLVFRVFSVIDRCKLTTTIFLYYLAYYILSGQPWCASWFQSGLTK